MKKPSWEERLNAERRYAEYRQEAMDFVNSYLVDKAGLPVLLRHIREEDIKIAENWYDLNRDNSDIWLAQWDWREEVRRARRRPRRVELAIECERQLYALILGRISDSKIVISISFMAKTSIDESCGSVLGVAIRYVEALAVILGSEMITINDPVQALEDYYRQQGFKPQDVKKSGRVRSMVRPVTR